jgi:DNA-binding transcriptional LysR family regulator
MDLRQLRYAVAVAEEGTVTGAAARLFVSQPAVSKQLRALERELGAELFVRDAQGMTPSPAGEALLAGARDLLDGWDVTLARVREIARTPRLVVGMQTAIGRGIHRAALDRFRIARPSTTLSLRLVPWHDPTGGLADGSSDVAFLWAPSDEGFASVTVARERRLIALPADSPLASRPRLRFDDVASVPLVALPESAGALRAWWLADDLRTTPAEVAATAEDADTALELVASGVGAVLLAEGNAGLYPRAGVVCKPVDGLPDAELRLAWRPDDARREVRDFVAAVDAVEQAPAS